MRYRFALYVYLLQFRPSPGETDPFLHTEREEGLCLFLLYWPTAPFCCRWIKQTALKGAGFSEAVQSPHCLSLCKGKRFSLFNGSILMINSYHANFHGQSPFLPLLFGRFQNMLHVYFSYFGEFPKALKYAARFIAILFKDRPPGILFISRHIVDGVISRHYH